MNDIKRILVVSRMTQYCRKAVQTGVSLAKKYGAELYLVHAIHNPFGLAGWNIGGLFDVETEYKKLLQKTRKDLDEIIASEKEQGMSVHVLIPQGEPTKEILNAVKEHSIDLLIMLAHEEGRVEHFLFGRSNETIFREMPCSILMVKKEPERTT
jgi:nucleotide-binding universal stress UspA family protein